MAYQTGTVASAVNLITVIETFAQAHGFVLTVIGPQNALSDAAGLSHTTLTYAASTGYDRVNVSGARDAAFTLNVCPGLSSLEVPSANWPVTYHLFFVPNPDTLYCVVVFGTFTSWLSFGSLIKPTTQYVGGNFFAAQRSSATNKGAFVGCTSTSSSFFNGLHVNASGMPFWGFLNSNSLVAATSHAYMEIDGYTWPTAVFNLTDLLTTNKLYSDLYTRTPNQWNQHTVLLPVSLVFKRGGTPTYYSDVGQVNGMRGLRIDNYLNGDIITLGSEQWMVFSPYKKDTVNRNGVAGSASYSTGTFGFAILYDP